MKDLHDNEKAGAAPTAADPLNTDASSPVSSDSSNDVSLPEESPPEKTAIDGEDLLDRVLAFVLRFVKLPTESAAYAVVAWAGHSHLMDAFDSTPRLAFLSAEPGSGKSRAMEITALLAPRAIEAANATTAALMRAVGDPAGTPTFFIDEIDTIYGANGKGDEALRGFINAGHRRGGGVLRCEPSDDSWIPTVQESYAAIAMAGIGNLPDTILTRSVGVPMRKRANGESVDPYRPRDHAHLGHALRDELEQWAKQILGKASVLRPNLPTEIVDRNADVWEPLIVVGDLAGGVWSDRIRQAAVEFVTIAKSDVQPSLGVQLLADTRNCFGTRDQLSTKELIGLLAADEEAPWGELRGKPIEPRKLASLLRPYGIKSENIWVDGSQCKGYKMESFHDAWVRYLPLVSEAVPSVTTVTDGEDPQECEDHQKVALRIDDGCDGSVPDRDS